eukprot:comp17787_c0_seq1/m.17837 comp17787_c0_seq1/g.17837  ORF comp17787_c0_seq1/g.17837 comp17787_c0_seq1/m.17837 type:complete len:473 (-) comp17787_c0_seq1:93-1511(-)
MLKDILSLGLLILAPLVLSQEAATTDSPSSTPTPKRYLLYRVNPGEGSNLRKDVMGRMIALMQSLNKHKWTLVLPPIRYVPHWHDLRWKVPVVTGERAKDRALAEREGTTVFPSWTEMVEIDNMQKIVDVIDYDDFIKEHGPVVNLTAHVLSKREIDFSKPLTAVISDCSLWNQSNCNYDIPDFTVENGMWHYCPLRTTHTTCVVGPASMTEMVPLMENELAGNPEEGKPHSVMLSRIETMMWPYMWSGDDYWKIRQHYVFTKELVDVARKFKADHGMEDGKYLAIHLRRGDFLYARGDKLPNLEEVAVQLKPIMDQRGLTKLFVATDASQQEIEELEKHMGVPVLNFKKSINTISPGSRKFHLTDGQIGIVDQLLCAAADYFLGSLDSTFSNTIFEERDLLGFDFDTTYHYLCPRKVKKEELARGAKEDDEFACRKPTRWVPPDMSKFRHYHPELLTPISQDKETETRDEL